MTTHSSILTWRISWTEEPGGLQSIGSQRVRHDWRDLAHTRKACYEVVDFWRMLSDAGYKQESQRQACKAKMRRSRLQNRWTTNSQECDIRWWQRTKSKLPEAVKVPRQLGIKWWSWWSGLRTIQNPGDQVKRTLQTWSQNNLCEQT